MLKSIEYSVTFLTTGRTLSETINFQKGFGTITGPNEAGKSFVIEMVRWALFGSSALRGNANEMKKAKAKLVFTVKGQAYTIERTTSNAKIFREKEQIAVGTRPVNEKVIQTLGFGLPVFDVACVANQGEIEKLVTMGATERKRLVDSVIGLSIIDDLAKMASEEASALRKLATDLGETTREPVLPERPEGYKDLAELDAELALMSEAQKELSEISGWLKNAPTEPVAPKEEVPLAVADLQDLVDVQEAKRGTVKRLEMELNTLPAASPYSDDALTEGANNHHRYTRWVLKRELLKNPKSEYTEEQLNEMMVQLACNEEVFKFNRLQGRMDELLEAGGHTCPKCSHHWKVEQEAIEKLQAEIDQIDEGMLKHAPVDLTAPLIEKEREKIRFWKETVEPQLAEYEGVEECRKPEISLAEIESHINRNKFAAQRQALETELTAAKAALEGQPDYADMLRKRQRYEDQYEDWKVKVNAYHQWLTDATEKAIRQKVLEAEIEGQSELAALRTAVVVYDTMMTRYHSDMQAYTETMQTVQATLEEVVEWDKAKTALTTLRGLVKQHLMPSLNKVSSFYLGQMTGGQRQSIYTDEDFNISVDGQPLHTLSGSGKAVACLSLRLGLGQVLTNNIFSLFVGDEIDASMDKSRADNTAATLQTLKTRISQILLITHKFPTADYYITVGNKHAEPETIS